jgi:hypothetical protein
MTMKKIIVAALAALALPAGAMANAASVVSDGSGRAEILQNNLVEVQAHGFWTNCWVDVSWDHQMAIPNAKSQQACQSAAIKCMNGQANVQWRFSTTAVLQSTSTVSRCDLAY